MSEAIDAKPIAGSLKDDIGMSSFPDPGTEAFPEKVDARSTGVAIALMAVSSAGRAPEVVQIDVI
jgi:hypothetical protein